MLVLNVQLAQRSLLRWQRSRTTWRRPLQPMTQIALAFVTVSFLAWLYLLMFHGRFWRADQRLEEALQALEQWPALVAIIPARNEADTIGSVIASHLASTYGGDYSIVLVDDHSHDGTAHIAENLAQGSVRPITVTRAPDLETGWTGKLWALQHGLAVAARKAPAARFVLLTDADIVYTPDTLSRLVGKAEQDDLTAVSLMAKLDSRGLWGSLLIPAFVFFFQKLYPFPRVNQPDNPAAAAAGGCVLVRRSVLTELGGLEAIKGELIDDCALARLLKARPPVCKIWLGLSNDVTSLRDNRALASIWAMVTRTAYTQLNRSSALLLGTIFAMAVLYLAGPIAVFTLPLHASAAIAGLGAAAWVAMAVTYLPTLSFYGKPSLLALTLPLSAAVYVLMTLASALQHWRGRGGTWKGRSYS